MFAARLRNLHVGKPRERERDVSVTRERFGMFIFLENTRPSLGTRGMGRRGLDRGTDIA